MLSFPALQGTIDRRILINYQVSPEVIERILPAPFRPKLVAGKSVAGICLIRLKYIRPRGLPPCITVASENAAHRIAVEWDDERGRRLEGVYVPRRDTSSRLVSFVGGRLFPGVLHQANFEVEETAEHLHVSMTSADGVTQVTVDAKLAPDLSDSSLFSSLDAASAFFEAGSVAYSPGRSPGAYDGLELQTTHWRVEPLTVHHVRSSFFEDTNLFPPGSVMFDHALLMRRIEHQWRGRGVLIAGAAGAAMGQRSA